MADTADADGQTRAPGVDAWQRAGMTRREAIRRERVERWRAETLSPWEARAPGLVVWLLWRTVFKGFQPLWLLASLAATAWFAAQWLAQTGGLMAHVGPQPGEADRLAARVQAALPAETDARTLWTARLTEALRGDARRRADIDRFRSWAALGPDLIGRDRLALDRLAGAAGPRALDATLRAGPAWQRRQRLDEAWQGALREGEALGLQPPALVFAPEALRTRAAERQFAWAVARESADGFFRGDHRGQFELRSVPGLVANGHAGPTRLYGGVRHLVIQYCADPGLRQAGCDSPIIPPAARDDLGLALGAIEAGLVDLPARRRAMMSGAEILTAARRAGRLNPQLEAWLASHLPDLLPSRALGDALDGAGFRPDLAFAAPTRAAPQLSARLDVRTHDSAVAVAELLLRVADIRARTSSFEAIRLMAWPTSPQQTEDLARIVALSGPASLATMEWLGEGSYDALLPVPERPRADPAIRQAVTLSAGSALVVLLLTLIRLGTPRRFRLASRTSLTDAWISRLLLGRKI